MRILRTYRNAWSMPEVGRLRQLAGEGLSPLQAAKALGRSESAVRNKAVLHGISFRRAPRTELRVMTGGPFSPADVPSA